MTKPLRAILMLTIIGLVCAPRPARAQAVFNVGSFTKSTTTVGCPASCTNTVPHGLGVAPQALILWTNGSLTGAGGSATFRFAFGVTDGTTSRSTSAASKNGAKPSASSRRASASVITIAETDGVTLLADATLNQASDATNFYLQWNPNDASAYVIHFIAIGGTGVQANVVDWQATASVQGTNCAAVPSPCVSVSGLPFQPSVVLNFMDYDAAALGANTSCGCLADAAFMLGVMDAGLHQWATAFYSKSGLTTTASARAQRTDAAIEETDSTGTAGGETMRANLVSIDATGWTVDFTKNTVGAHHIFSLAMTGVNLWTGQFNRTATTCNPCSPVISQAVPINAGFTPSAVLLASFTDVTQAAPEAHGLFSFGAATDTTHRGVSAAVDISGRVLAGALKSAAWDWDWTTKFFGMYNQTNSIVGEADLGSMDAVGSAGNPTGGFTLNWTLLNFATATNEINYLALGPLSATAVTLESFTATRLPDGKTHLQWRTGYEVDNVGFRVYREQNGQRVRITSSLVPGTALIGVGRGASLGNRTYSWSDAAPPADDGPAQYWLEDVDRHGKSTWHGPIVAGMAGSDKDR